MRYKRPPMKHVCAKHHWNSDEPCFHCAADKAEAAYAKELAKEK